MAEKNQEERSRSKYQPEYAEGQIVVFFKERVSENFALEFAKHMGYEEIDEPYSLGNEAYVFKTKPGREKKALDKFKSYEEFVDGAELRDIKIERIWDDLGWGGDMIQNIGDRTGELSDEDYERAIESVREYLEKIKPKYREGLERKTQDEEQKRRGG